MNREGLSGHSAAEGGKWGVKGEGLIWVGHDKWSQRLVGEELLNGEEFLSKLENWEELEGGLEKRKGKGGKREKG